MTHKACSLEGVDKLIFENLITILKQKIASVQNYVSILRDIISDIKLMIKNTEAKTRVIITRTEAKARRPVASVRYNNSGFCFSIFICLILSEIKLVKRK